jgi:hypothetical protein
LQAPDLFGTPEAVKQGANDAGAQDRDPRSAVKVADKTENDRVTEHYKPTQPIDSGYIGDLDEPV